MDDMKDKVKGFMKKVNNPFTSSSSGKFKGQGRVLGSSSSGPANSIPVRSLQQIPNSTPASASASANSRPLPQKPVSSEQNRSEPSSKPNPNRNPENGFDPFGSLITTGKRNPNGCSLNVYECPICGQSFRSEGEVSAHVDTCVSNPVGCDEENGLVESSNNGVEARSKMEACIGTYISGNPSEGSVEVVLRLLRNIVKEPENTKFRKIRMGNPKIKEAVCEVAGGLELLEFVGFELKEEDGDTWAVMEVPTGDQKNIITNSITLLERQKVQEPQKKETLPSATSKVDEQVAPTKIDRQVNLVVVSSKKCRNKHYGIAILWHLHLLWHFFLLNICPLCFAISGVYYRHSF